MAKTSQDLAKTGFWCCIGALPLLGLMLWGQSGQQQATQARQGQLPSLQQQRHDMHQRQQVSRQHSGAKLLERHLQQTRQRQSAAHYLQQQQQPTELSAKQQAEAAQKQAGKQLAAVEDKPAGLQQGEDKQQDLQPQAGATAPQQDEYRQFLAQAQREALNSKQAWKELCLLAQVQKQAGDLKGALASLELAKRLGNAATQGGNQTQLFEIALKQAELGFFEQAQDSVYSLNDSNSKNQGMLMLVEQYCKHARIGLAKNSCYAISDATLRDRAWAIIAHSYLDNNDLHSALQCISNVSNTPHKNLCYVSLVKVLAERGDFANATQQLVLISDTSQRDQAQLSISLAAARQGNSKVATNQLWNIRQPKLRDEALSAVAHALLRQQRLQEATKMCNAISQRQMRDHIWARMALEEINLGKHSAGINRLQSISDQQALTSALEQIAVSVSTQKSAAKARNMIASIPKPFAQDRAYIALARKLHANDNHKETNETLSRIKNAKLKLMCLSELALMSSQRAASNRANELIAQANLLAAAQHPLWHSDEYQRNIALGHLLLKQSDLAEAHLQSIRQPQLKDEIWQQVSLQRLQDEDIHAAQACVANIVKHDLQLQCMQELALRYATRMDVRLANQQAAKLNLSVQRSIFWREVLKKKITG